MPGPQLKKISPAQLVPMDLFAGSFPLRVDLTYTKEAPESFCGAIYRPGAKLWLHEDLARVVLGAARLADQRHGLRLVLYDGLRTVSAQEKIRDTDIVQANPQWLEGDTRLLSPPGRGAHPRGMAIDLALETKEGVLLDMGTAFDELATNGSGPATNRAHREYDGHGAEVMDNRAKLTGCMMDAAKALGLELLPLPQEWWDYRFPPHIYDQYEPLADSDLPPQMRMIAGPDQPPPQDFPAQHFSALQARLLKITP